MRLVSSASQAAWAGASAPGRPGGGRVRWIWVLALGWGMGLAPRAALAPEGTPSEYEVKAAWLLNFAKFTEWPGQVFATAQAPMVIGVLGEDHFGKDLDQTLHDKQAKGRPVLVRRLRHPQDPLQCHILFVSASEDRRAEDILDSIRLKPILTIGESETFARHGGMIQFVRKESFVRFHINLESAKAARLKISPQLLSVALSVQGTLNTP